MGNIIEEVVKDMTPRLIGDLGMRYPTEKSTKKVRYGWFECVYCGKEFETNIQSVKCGDTKSCGCLVGKNMTHGFSYHKFYQTWYDMKYRCYNTKRREYKWYGARGITVCEEWQDVTNFVAWAEKTHPNVKGVTLDRIDNDKGYSPDNCRWTDATTQCVNQGMKSSNTSGFVGIYWHKNVKKWISVIEYQKSHINIGSFRTKEEAVQARDNYIIENNLPHKLSTDYKKEK